MVVYNFKKIQTVPPGSEIIDIVLTRTQRRTPTVVHPGYAITRIRQFYMRKVKFTQQTCQDKLSQIIEDFPRLDDIHPFYAALINVLYDKDHYKLALGQINTARQLITKVSQDYVRLLKYGETLYRCKQLKRAALGRMCTILKKLGPSLGYLEEVRKHLSRLPSIDPNTRTLILCGYPNVGKSSFMNKVTRAEVEVQPYAFTTKSLFVGHMDYKYLRWQVIDTPGILDHPLEDMNTIEMQAITALAHLQCAVLYMVDVSCQCGYTIEQQCALFSNVKPLFANKDVFMVCNKIDVRPMSDLSPEERTMLERTASECGAEVMTMSNVSEEGVSAVKLRACEKLLERRVTQKMRTKKVGDVLNRLHVAVPKTRDERERDIVMPEAVKQKRQALAAARAEAEAAAKMEGEDPYAAAAVAMKSVLESWPKRRTLREVQWEHGGPGVFNFDLTSHYDLADPAWRTDMVPEIMDGKNVMDYYDPDIEARLQALEAEEAAAEEAAAAAAAGAGGMEEEEEEDEGEDLTPEERAQLATIRGKRSVARALQQMDKPARAARPHKHRVPSAPKAAAALEAVGLPGAPVLERGRKRHRPMTEEVRSESRARAAAEAEGGEASRRSASRVRSLSRSRAPPEKAPEEMGLRNVRQKTDAIKLRHKAQRKPNQNARKGEGDRVILNMMPKHLFSGKRGMGKTDRR